MTFLSIDRKRLNCRRQKADIRKDTPMGMLESINSKLKSAFSPAFLEILDESDQHAGHGGWREGQTTHVRIRIKTAAFQGKNRVAIHREINALLADELAAGLHALAIEASAA
jgi:BolA family transcriptional regulator, general stress-responsive regulator